MKSKCSVVGCYEPLDCHHGKNDERRGYCTKHCPGDHKIRAHNRRYTPKSNVPHMGVEIEVEFDCPHDLKRTVTLGAHHDGSLNVGAEFKVVAPTTQIAKKCAGLLEELWLRKARAKSSCGLHVHLDMRQAGADRKQALREWAFRTQDVWFTLVPSSRRLNGFCRPMVNQHSNGHYYWLNSTNYNTIEIRLHGGTVNVYKLLGWLSALAHLQAKTHDSNFTFPNTGNAEADFWAVFADCPKEGKEYLQTRKDNNGVIRDYAFAPLEEATA